jgi:hypothetical protein
MMRELQPMRWPTPVPLLWWTGDYTDIRERVRRDGRLDTDEVWLPDSEDGWQSFCSRHGTYGFDWDWYEWNDADRARIQAANRAAAERQAERAKQAQEAWEAEQRRRQQAKQEAADREWQEVAQARAYWSRFSPRYADEPFVLVRIAMGGKAGPVTLQGGHAYWLPKTIADSLRQRAAA